MFRVIISTLLSGILCLCSVVGKCESIDLDKNTLLKENIVKVEINVVIIPIRDSQYCYMFETNKREQIEYLMHMLETMDFIDDGKTRYGADVPMVYIYLTDKNDTTYKCGFYNGRFCDDSEKQYAVNSDDYRRFLSFVYALKTGKIVLDKDVTFTPSDWAYKDIESAKDMGNGIKLIIRVKSIGSKYARFRRQCLKKRDLHYRVGIKIRFPIPGIRMYAF